MKFPRKYTLKEIAEISGTTPIGAADFPVYGLNEIHRVEAGDIVFVDHPKYYEKALNSAATIVLINKEVECPAGKALLLSDDPFRDFVKIGQFFKPFQPATDAISPDAEIGEGTIIQPNVFIGNNVKIGKNCVIHANVSINDDAFIGDDVIIRSGTILGADAFYYKKRENGYDRLKSVGNVIIEDGVEIGANCTIDRGVTASTIIKKGSVLDNQIQIGHDTIIGERCLIASQVGIAGCVTIENDVNIWGQVGITSGVTIGEKTILYAQSGVTKSLEGHQAYFGSPAEEAKKMYKKMALTQIMLKEYRNKTND